ncbi:unnamed protein product [Ilex paraguariensis]|uniref:Uncharacterized protein n=1 Tax=Ilex paraguariensis TaxID=185542 RepID=A0ABC8UDU1_9AQUA
MEARRGVRPSWIWSNLLVGRELLSKGLRWQVRSGDQINFWKNRWIPTLPSFSITPLKPFNCNIEYVEDVINQSSKAWDMTILQKVSSTKEQQVMKTIPISKMKEEDKRI